MASITAGLMAAAAAWAGNRAALKLLGARAIIVLAPLVEELAKTGAALTLGAPVVWSHLVFGLVEGLYDAWASGLQGFMAGLMSLAGHLFYGYITFQVLQKHVVWPAAVLAGYTVHMLWNITVMKFIVIRKREHN